MSYWFSQSAAKHINAEKVEWQLFEGSREKYDVCEQRKVVVVGGVCKVCVSVCVCVTTVRRDPAQAPTQLCHITGRLETHTCQARQSLLQ